MNDNFGNDNLGNGVDKQDADEQQLAIIVNGQYIKDLSFEAPGSPAILAELQDGQQPDINVNFNVKAGKIEGQPANNLFEVVLELQAEMKLNDKIGFIVELQYGGIFTLNVPEEHLNAVQMIECPRILFPYVRSILSDVTRDGGFVPLFLQPIDFNAMYQAGVQQDLKNLDAQVAEIVDEKDES